MEPMDWEGVNCLGSKISNEERIGGSSCVMKCMQLEGLVGGWAMKLRIRFEFFALNSVNLCFTPRYLDTIGVV